MLAADRDSTVTVKIWRKASNPLLNPQEAAFSSLNPVVCVLPCAVPTAIMVKRTSTPQRLESLFATLANSLATESSSAQSSKDCAAQQRAWDRSKCKKQLETFLDFLLQVEMQTRDSRGLSEGMEHALEIGAFDLIAGFGQMDRPAGMLASVLSFYSRLLAGVNKELLFPNVAFHRSIQSLLLTISDNLKKGHCFYQSDNEILTFLHSVCERVHRLPLLLEILLVKDQNFTDEYLPLSILLHYFKQEKYDSDPKVLELMHFCVQLDKREVLARLISHTDFASALISKLVVLFKQLPEGGKLRSREIRGEETAKFEKYCRFLDELCEKCQWQDLLSSLSGIFHHHFCEKVVFPRLSTSPVQTLYVSTIQNLSLMVRALNSPLFLTTICSFLVGNKARTEESPSRPAASPSAHCRQFQSYDTLMFTAGHCKNQSSASTCQDSPIRSVALGEGLGYRENGRAQSGQVDYSGVWLNCVSAVAEPRMTEVKRMYLLLLFELVHKGDLSITHLLFSSHFANPPKSLEITITVSAFLKPFSPNTCTRVQTLTTTRSFGSAVWDFTRSDILQTEDLEACVLPEELAVISEKLSSEVLSEEEDAFTTPDKPKHERTGTTVFHRETESAEMEVQTWEQARFYPGPLLESLIKSLENALAEEAEDLTLILGIIEELCRFPYVDLSTNVLFWYLLELAPSEEPTLRTVLKRLDTAVDAQLEASVQTSSLERRFRPSSPRTQLTSSARNPHIQLSSDPADSSFLRVRPMQRVEALDRFVARLCDRIQVWERVQVVKKSCVEDWVYDMRKCDT